ncbi:hypothetical protein, partial [Saccharopolyspora sp. 6M]|uniref:hypothetical protein n=1 Tax=Saccharopolyspora sp. 6M TaxID=2877237 RepID=UPI001CD57B99
MVLRERENETELLSAALDRASEGGGALLAFSGPFGIGRSAVLAGGGGAPPPPARPGGGGGGAPPPPPPPRRGRAARREGGPP